MATGAYRSSSPWSASIRQASADTVFVVDQTLMIVSRSHGADGAASVVDRAAPQVDDQLAVDRDGDRRAVVVDRVVALDEVGLERLPHARSNRSSHVPSMVIADGTWRP